MALTEREWPRFGIPEVTILGLENAWVMDNPGVEQPGFGYRATVSVEFGYYDPANYPSLSTLVFNGTWTLDQCACSAPKAGPAACNVAAVLRMMKNAMRLENPIPM